MIQTMEEKWIYPWHERHACDYWNHIISYHVLPSGCFQVCVCVWERESVCVCVRVCLCMPLDMSRILRSKRCISMYFIGSVLVASCDWVYGPCQGYEALPISCSCLDWAGHLGHFTGRRWAAAAGCFLVVSCVIGFGFRLTFAPSPS